MAIAAVLPSESISVSLQLPRGSLPSQSTLMAAPVEVCV